MTKYELIKEVKSSLDILKRDGITVDDCVRDPVESVQQIIDMLELTARAVKFTLAQYKHQNKI